MVQDCNVPCVPCDIFTKLLLKDLIRLLNIFQSPLCSIFVIETGRTVGRSSRHVYPAERHQDVDGII